MELEKLRDMEEPINLEVPTKKDVPVFTISNYSMVVHALLILLISIIYGSSYTLVILALAALMVYDNINRNTLSIKAAIPFFVLVAAYYVTFIVNFIVNKSFSFTNIGYFFVVMFYINFYMICIMFNFNLVKEVVGVDKKILILVLGIMHSLLSFLCVPAVAYAVVDMIPALTNYIPLVFFVVHIVTVPKCDDPILICFVNVISMISSVFCYLEDGQMFIIMLPLSLYLNILSSYVNVLAPISIPMFIGACCMLITNNILIFVLVCIISLIFVLSMFKPVNVFESTVCAVLIGYLVEVILEQTSFSLFMRIAYAVGIALIASRLCFTLDLFVYAPIATMVICLFSYLHISYHHIEFHIARFIIFNLRLYDFTLIYAGFVLFTMMVPYLMTKFNRGFFSLVMIAYSFGLATIEYIVASRRNGIFYHDSYCVFTGIALSLIGYLMLKTKKIYLTSFAIVISIQIAKLTMFVFPRYVTIISVAFYLATIIIRQSYQPDIERTFIFGVVNLIWNFLVSVTVSFTFISTLYLIFLGINPSFMQIMIAAAALTFLLTAHDYWVQKSSILSIPITGFFGSIFALFITLGESSNIGLLGVVFTVTLVIMTSSKKTYSLGNNMLTRLIFSVSFSFCIATYLYEYISFTPFWFFFVLWGPAFLGTIATLEVICANRRTVVFSLPVYGMICGSFPASLVATAVATRNVILLKSIGAVLCSLHFTIHVAILIAVNISHKVLLKKNPQVPVITVLSAPFSLVLGVVLHIFLLKGSPVALLCFAPLMELLILDKFAKFDEYKKSAGVILATMILLPIITLSRFVTVGFSVEIFLSYLFVVVWSVMLVQFVLFLFVGKDAFPYPIILVLLQFVASAVIMVFVKNELVFTECLFVMIVTPFDIYLRTRKPKEDDALAL